MRHLILDFPRDRLPIMLAALEGHAGMCVADLTAQLVQDADSDGGGGTHAPAAMLTCARSAVHVIVSAAASGVIDSTGRHCVTVTCAWPYACALVTCCGVVLSMLLVKLPLLISLDVFVSFIGFNIDLLSS